MREIYRYSVLQLLYLEIMGKLPQRPLFLHWAEQQPMVLVVSLINFIRLHYDCFFISKSIFRCYLLFIAYTNYSTKV